MALILKPSKTFSDNKGNTYNAPYLVVDRVITDKYTESQDIQVKIFRDEAARIEGKSPVEIRRHNCIDPTEFDTFFGIIAINNDDNTFKQSYLYLETIKDEDDNLIYEDWLWDEIS